MWFLRRRICCAVAGVVQRGFQRVGLEVDVGETSSMDALEHLTSDGFHAVDVGRRASLWPLGVKTNVGMKELMPSTSAKHWS